MRVSHGAHSSRQRASLHFLEWDEGTTKKMTPLIAHALSLSLERPHSARYDVSYSDPPLRASRFSCQTSAISAGRQRLSEGHHALPGPPDGAGLLLMDPAEVPNQLESRRRAAATTSQLFSAVEDGAPKE